MKTTVDLSGLKWSLAGYSPFQWGWARSMETGIATISEIPAVPAKVPGSVQSALRNAGMLPDWTRGLKSKECEWVENRHWIFETTIPGKYCVKELNVRLRCEGLDGMGRVLVNGNEIAKFANSFIPHIFEIGSSLRDGDNRLQIVFECQPRWLGQLGWTSQMTEWKVRFNYTWDWLPRLVQIGIWDGIFLEITDGNEMGELELSSGKDSLRVKAGPGKIRASLHDGGKLIRSAEFSGELSWDSLPVETWWPNGHGDSKLYDLECVHLESGEIRRFKVGFKSLEWRQCEGAPPGADPWICTVNGKPIFLQGVNWTPLKPNFADTGDDEYRKMLETYKDMGCNVLRVWGGAFLEKEIFYDLCDELGLLVWQEFPICSSGYDNWPPEDERSISDLEIIAESYVKRRRHHASLLCWCGGNELQGALDGSKTGFGKPVDSGHPLIGRIEKIVKKLDPAHRFLATSSSGPRFTAEKKDYGKGLHWDVHGPWNPEADDYWEGDDSLFRSELGAPGASSAALSEVYSDGMPLMPANIENPLWRRNPWWIQWNDFLKTHGREPSGIEEFVEWSQSIQAEAIERAINSCKSRFPKCGGVILWMGHDCFPCTANTAIIEFDGKLKKAARRVAELFRSPQNS